MFFCCSTFALELKHLLRCQISVEMPRRVGRSQTLIGSVDIPAVLGLGYLVWTVVGSILSVRELIRSY
jgi:hypothetical protein